MTTRTDEFTGRVYLEGDKNRPLIATFWLHGDKAYCQVGSMDYEVNMMLGVIRDNVVIAGMTFRRLLKLVRKAKERSGEN